MEREGKLERKDSQEGRKRRKRRHSCARIEVLKNQRLCLCMCVCDRETERERERESFFIEYLSVLIIVHCVLM